MTRTISRRARIALLVGFCLLGIFIASCATQPAATDGDVPGFFSGLLHGILIFFSLIGSVFTDFRIYAFPNSGGWYDFGFVLGAAAVLGGTGASAG